MLLLLLLNGLLWRLGLRLRLRLRLLLILLLLARERCRCELCWALQLLSGLRLELRNGPPTVLLGPNGAGKTTLVKIMMSVVRPSHAFGTILGRPLGHRGKLATTGYLPESPRFPPYLTGFQLLEYFGHIVRA